MTSAALLDEAFRSKYLLRVDQLTVPGLPPVVVAYTAGPLTGCPEGQRRACICPLTAAVSFLPR
jgi:hypothetical protein